MSAQPSKAARGPGATLHDYQVVVLGGGPAGCATALALARRGVSPVLVAELGYSEAGRVGESIPPDTRLLLEELGICEDFLHEGHDACFGSCSSWGDPTLGYNDFLLNPHGNGWHLDRRRFDTFLARQTTCAGVELTTGLGFRNGEELGGEGFRLHLAGKDSPGREVTTAFVVDATGMRACFARHMGARRRFLDRLLCIYGFFAINDASDFPALTMLEAVEYGWWYAAKLPELRLAAAVAGDPEWIRRNGLHKANGWMEHLLKTRHLAARLAACRFLEESLLIAPAPSFLLDRVAGHRWLAVGDAASAFDPISSQGIHKALSNGLQAAAAITACLAGNESWLEEYQDAVTTRYEGFVEIRDFFYGQEERWSQSPFWMNRQRQS